MFFYLQRNPFTMDRCYDDVTDPPQNTKATATGTGTLAYQIDFDANEAPNEFRGDQHTLRQAFEILGRIRSRGKTHETNTIGPGRIAAAQTAILEGAPPDTATLVGIAAHPTYYSDEEFLTALHAIGDMTRHVFHRHRNPGEDARCPYQATGSRNGDIDLIEMVNRYYSREVLEYMQRNSLTAEYATDRVGRLVPVHEFDPDTVQRSLRSLQEEEEPDDHKTKPTPLDNEPPTPRGPLPCGPANEATNPRPTTDGSDGGAGGAYAPGSP